MIIKSLKVEGRVKCPADGVACIQINCSRWHLQTELNYLCQSFVQTLPDGVFCKNCNLSSINPPIESEIYQEAKA